MVCMCVKKNPLCHSHCRECIDGFKYIVPNSTYRHCSRGCATQTMCGTIVIPEEHLQVSTYVK